MPSVTVMFLVNGERLTRDGRAAETWWRLEALHRAFFGLLVTLIASATAGTLAGPAGRWVLPPSGGREACRRVLRRDGRRSLGARRSRDVHRRGAKPGRPPGPVGTAGSAREGAGRVHGTACTRSCGWAAGAWTAAGRLRAWPLEDGTTALGGLRERRAVRCRWGRGPVCGMMTRRTGGAATAGSAGDSGAAGGCGAGVGATAAAGVFGSGVATNRSGLWRPALLLAELPGLLRAWLLAVG